MENKLKYFFTTIFSSCLLFLLTSCSRDMTVSLSSNSTSSNGDSRISNTAVANQDLSIIENRCSGCGRCVRTDPEHFALNNDRKAEVISNNNLNSSKLTVAMNVCHSQAIKLL